MAEQVSIAFNVRYSWWFWPVCAASLALPFLKPLALAGIRLEVA